MMTKYMIPLFLCALMFSGANLASADSVKIKMTDGSFAVAGELVSDRGLNYVLKTPFGKMHIAKTVATCEGCGPTIMAMAE